MRRWLMAGAAVAVLTGGGAAFTHAALAQPAPPPPVRDDMAPPPPHGGPGPHGEMMGGGMMGHHGPGGHEEMMRRMRTFALVFRAPDRNLGAADVQKIAEGFLLWNGNHTWKVTNVQEQGERVAFSLATPDGGVIATFTMDRHTGQLERTG